LEALFKALKVGESVDELLEKFTAYQNDMLPHFAEEESIGLPLVLAYFTAADLKPTISQLIKHSPKTENGSIVESCTPEVFRSTFMVNEGIPFFVWYIVFYWNHKAFLNQFTNKVQALKDGVPLIEKKKTFYFF
jgi:hypothetical protein